MFATMAACIFVSGFALAAAVILWMFAQYSDKIVAALLIEPMPHTARACHVDITRRRVRPAGTTRPPPARTALAA